MIWRANHPMRAELNRASVLACVLFFFGPITAAPQRVVLRFSESALVNDTIVRLGDVATIGSDLPAAVVAELSSLSLGTAAPAGYSRFVAVSDLISYRLRSQFPQFEFSPVGPTRIEVTTDFIEHRLPQYLPLVLDYLKREVRWGAGDWSASIEDTTAVWKTLRGPTSIEVKGLQNPYPKGNVTVSLVMKQGSRLRRIPVVCNVRVETAVLVASRTIGRAKVIGAQDIEVRRIDITRLGPTPFVELRQVVGTTASRTIDAGSIVHDRMVKATPIVQKGDQVYIGLRTGSVKVSVPAIAREPGVVGDRIWVENALTHKLVRVTVRGKGSVSALQGGENI